MALRIIWNDILQEKADAIVTPASRNPRIGTGLDKLVHQVAGPEPPEYPAFVSFTCHH